MSQVCDAAALRAALDLLLAQSPVDLSEVPPLLLLLAAACKPQPNAAAPSAASSSSDAAAGSARGGGRGRGRGRGAAASRGGSGDGGGGGGGGGADSASAAAAAEAAAQRPQLPRLLHEVVQHGHKRGFIREAMAAHSRVIRIQERAPDAMPRCI